jgi:hypothetical protein
VALVASGLLLISCGGGSSKGGSAQTGSTASTAALKRLEVEVAPRGSAALPPAPLWAGGHELAAGAAAAAAAKGTKGGSRPASAGTPASPAEGEQKADNGRIQFRIVSAQGREETVTFDLPRPAIPASVMALVTRRESIERPSQLGDTLTDEIAGGLLVMTSVTPAAHSAARRRMAPTQAPFFRVLVKGERVLPKPGRIDDFSWPKPEQSAEAEGAAPAGKDAGTVRARARGG